MGPRENNLSLKRRDFLKWTAFVTATGFISRREALAQLAPASNPGGPRKRILILGAGISGLAAALRLVEAGHDVEILEARRRPGGRVHTIREPFSDGLYAEAGAGRIPPTHALTLEYVKRFKLDLDIFYPESGAKIFLWRGKRVVVPFGQSPITADFKTNFTAQERKEGFDGLDPLYIEPLRKELSACGPEAWPYPQLPRYRNASMQEYLRSRGASSNAIEFLCNGFEGDSVIDYVHDSISHAVPNLWKIRGGNDLLPRAMAEKLRDKIRYGAEVILIEQTGNGVRAVVKSLGLTQTVDGDHLICTLPFPVLRQIQATPAWSPKKQRAIHDAYMGPVLRAFAQTRTRFWEKNGLNGFATADRPMEIWSPTFNQPGQRGIVMSYCYERMANEYSALSAEKRIARTLDLFEQVHPGIKEQTEAAASFSWSDEKFSRGAYAVTRPGDFDTIYTPGVLPEGRIHFAGEHISLWPGWIQGALQSGLRAANEII